MREKESSDLFQRIRDNISFFIILRMELPFTCKNGTLLEKVWKYESLLRTLKLWRIKFNNNANFLNTLRSIKQVDVLYLLALTLISSPIRLFILSFFSILVTWLVKYGCVSKLLKDSSIKQSCAKISSVRGLVAKSWRSEIFLSNKLVVQKYPHTILETKASARQTISTATLFVY